MYFPMCYPFSTKIALLQRCVTLLELNLDIGTILTSVWKKFSLNNNVNAVVLGRMYRSMLSPSLRIGEQYCPSIHIDRYILPRTTAFPHSEIGIFFFSLLSTYSGVYLFEIFSTKEVGKIELMKKKCFIF